LINSGRHSNSNREEQRLSWIHPRNIKEVKEALRRTNQVMKKRADKK